MFQILYGFKDLLHYHIWVTSKVEVNLRYRKYSNILIPIDFHTFFTSYVFEVHAGESIADIPAKLSYLGDFENPGELPVLDALWGTDRFWYFFHLLCFRGQKINSWHSAETCFDDLKISARTLLVSQT